jgi:hypothetical protein
MLTREYKSEAKPFPSVFVFVRYNFKSFEPPYALLTINIIIVSKEVY